MGTMHGETENNLRKLFAEAAHHAPSVVLIDELDAVAPRREEVGAQSDLRMVTQLLSLLDGLLKVDGVVVIGTTNRIDAVDVALRRPGRFDKEIFVGPPSAEGRYEVLKIHAREMALTKEAEQYLEYVSEVTHGFVGADLMELCREAGLCALRRSTSGLADHLSAFRIGHESLSVDVRDFEEALTTTRPSASRESFISIANVTWSDVGGLEDPKTRLQELVTMPLRNPEVLQEARIDSLGGILLHGPSGSGKSILAKAVANESGVNFLTLDGPEVFNKWLGESEESIRRIFRIAKQLAPSIVFFDQLDALAPSRGDDSGSRTTERVVNQLLAEMDGMKAAQDNVVVMAATNRLDLVDPSVLRPGRFGIHLSVPLPNLEDRKEILQIKLQDWRIDGDRQQIVDRLAEYTEGYSGADLHAVCLENKLRVLTREHRSTLKESDFDSVLDGITVAT